MGSPLGPLLADVSMGKLENEPLCQIITKFSTYKRYVDDIFCVCPIELDLDNTLSVFNNAHTNIKFTKKRKTKIN